MTPARSCFSIMLKVCAVVPSDGIRLNSSVMLLASVTKPYIHRSLTNRHYLCAEMYIPEIRHIVIDSDAIQV